MKRFHRLVSDDLMSPSLKRTFPHPLVDFLCTGEYKEPQSLVLDGQSLEEDTQLFEDSTQSADCN